jgi:hypothetical protein
MRTCLDDKGPVPILEMIETFVRHASLEEFAGCLVVVTDNRIRIRRPRSCSS